MAGEGATVCASKEGAVVRVTVSPGSSRPGIGEIRGGALHVRLRSAPEKGRANAELVEVLAEAFGVRRADVEITAGASSRKKRALLRGADAGEIEKLIERISSGGVIA